MDHCPKHKKLRLVRLDLKVGRSTRTAWMCPAPICGYTTVVPPERTKNPQHRLGIMPRERKQVVLKERESGISERIAERFRLHGYDVLVTSEQRKKVQCAEMKDGVRVGGCGRWFFPDNGTGADPGVPDIYVRDPHRYPPYWWVGIEVKGPTTDISDEQQTFAAKLGYCIAHSDDEAWEAVQWAESFLEVAIAEWRERCIEILAARQDQMDQEPRWEADRLVWLREQREEVVRIGRQRLAFLDAEIKQLAGDR